MRLSLTFSFLSAFLFAASGLALGCNESDEKSASSHNQEQVASSSAPNVKENAAPTRSVQGVPKQARARYEEEAFTLELSGPDSAVAGEAIELQIVLSAQGGYKVNEEYPIKFEFSEAKGVSPSQTVVTKDQATIEKKRAKLPAQVKLGDPGAHDVAGRLSFSVCTDERCLIEKRDLKLTINAS